MRQVMFIIGFLILSTLLLRVHGDGQEAVVKMEQQQQQQSVVKEREAFFSSRGDSALHDGAVAVNAQEFSIQQKEALHEEEEEEEEILEVSSFLVDDSSVSTMRLFWPFSDSKKNATSTDDSTAASSNNNNNNNNNNATAEITVSSSASCDSYKSCSDCTEASSWCHWCDSDHVCHAKASFYGCLSGSTCKNESKHDDKDKATGCASHVTCSECTGSSSYYSHVCHWCAHDNACHAIGSYYGCISGVDCYANDRCTRLHPEPISISNDDAYLIAEVGPLPVAVIVAIAALLGCCLSVCFCFASGVKGAYDDLVLVENDHVQMERQSPERSSSEQEQSSPTTIDTDDVMEHGESNEGADNGDADYARMPPDEEHATDVAHSSEESMPLITSPAEQQHRPMRRPPRRVQRLYNVCSLCYVGSLITIGGCAYGAYRSLPLAAPSYNVCNEESDWKSLIESLSSDFQILVSVANPNHFSFALDMASGNFTHKGNPVGTFQIPPVVAEPLSITDVLMVAHFAPEKWDALSITREFVAGRLTFLADAKATLRIPILLDYSITVSTRDIVIHANELGDRSLCACKTWQQPKEEDQKQLSPLPFL
jgi:hypothetical protein